MAAQPERDELTGVTTTGHVWDGIKELNNPLPKWWVYVFYATILFSMLWWVLYPAWPLPGGATPGVLGSNQRLELEQRLAAAREAQRVYLDRIAAADTAAILADQELLAFASVGGRIAFNNNCAQCHGLGGAGQGFFPTLADDDWLWGGTPEAIQTTITHGIRNGGDEARDSQMPAFGVDGILDRAQIGELVQHVLALGGREHDAAMAEAGAALFAENCAACHGEDGKGLQDFGAPNLTDAIWLYGGEPAQIEAQIWKPRLGVMPAFGGRLDETTIKMLTAYVHGLGGGE
jgi:cytochrome c oxidase cbb3-type subunit 3